MLAFKQNSKKNFLHKNKKIQAIIHKTKQLKFLFKLSCLMNLFLNEGINFQICYIILIL